jgi:hypothetical protein
MIFYTGVMTAILKNSFVLPQENANAAAITPWERRNTLKMRINFEPIKEEKSRLLISCTLGQEMWTKMETAYSKSAADSFLLLWSQFYGCKFLPLVIRGHLWSSDEGGSQKEDEWSRSDNKQRREERHDMTAVTVKVAVTSAIKIVTKRTGSIITATTMVVENSAKRKILGERNTEDLGDMAIQLLHQRE